MLELSSDRGFYRNVKDSDSPKTSTLRRRELIIVGALIFSMVVATGPGVLLVNRPETVFGFPIIYVWGIAWYFIIGGLAIAADRLVWRKDSRENDGTDPEDKNSQ